MMQRVVACAQPPHIEGLIVVVMMGINSQGSAANLTRLTHKDATL